MGRRELVGARVRRAAGWTPRSCALAVFDDGSGVRALRRRVRSRTAGGVAGEPTSRSGTARAGRRWARGAGMNAAVRALDGLRRRRRPRALRRRRASRARAALPRTASRSGTARAGRRLERRAARSSGRSRRSPSSTTAAARALRRRRLHRRGRRRGAAHREVGRRELVGARAAGSGRATPCSRSPCSTTAADPRSTRRHVHDRGRRRRRRIAKWDGSSWSALGHAGLDERRSSRARGVRRRQRAALYAGGDVHDRGRRPRDVRIARWDGSSWSALGAGQRAERLGPALAVFDDGSGPALYAGGELHRRGRRHRSPHRRVGRRELVGVGAPGSGMNDHVYALASFDDGSGPALYAGGIFTTAGGVAANRIAQVGRLELVGARHAGQRDEQRRACARGLRRRPGPRSTPAASSRSPAASPRTASRSGTASSWSAVGAPGSGTDNEVRCLAGFDDGKDGDPTSTSAACSRRPRASVFASLAQWHGCASVPSPHCFGDGSGGACPCANAGSAGHGCENSAATGGARARLAGTIVARHARADSTGELSSALSIFLQGSGELARRPSSATGCAARAGALKRLYVKNASSGSVTRAAAGDPSITAQSALARRSDRARLDARTTRSTTAIPISPSARARRAAASTSATRCASFGKAAPSSSGPSSPLPAR